MYGQGLSRALKVYFIVTTEHDAFEESHCNAFSLLVMISLNSYCAKDEFVIFSVFSLTLHVTFWISLLVLVRVSVLSPPTLYSVSKSPSPPRAGELVIKNLSM